MGRLVWMLMAIAVLGSVVALSMGGLGDGDGNGRRSAKPGSQIAKAAEREDEMQGRAELLFRDSAMRHLAAVRTGAASRPDEDLAHDIVILAGASRATFRDPRDVEDVMPRLAALREAMDALRPLNGARVDCPVRTVRIDARCDAYFKAMAALLDGGVA